MTFKGSVSDGARAALGIAVESPQCGWGCGQEKRGLGTEGPARQLAGTPILIKEIKKYVNNQQFIANA